jgi:hypothetical protein
LFYSQVLVLSNFLFCFGISAQAFSSLSASNSCNDFLAENVAEPFLVAIYHVFTICISSASFRASLSNTMMVTQVAACMSMYTCGWLSAAGLVDL